MAQDYSKSFYNSKNWKQCRFLYMMSKDCLCERCGRLADIVHHKKYITEENINNPEITIHWDNLEALCIECHNREHITTEATADGIFFDSKGNL